MIWIPIHVDLEERCRTTQPQIATRCRRVWSATLAMTRSRGERKRFGHIGKNRVGLVAGVRLELTTKGQGVCLAFQVDLAEMSERRVGFAEL
jgi:hypothetical protein